MKIAISVESSADMPKELLKEKNVYCVPFTVFLGKDEYADGEISTDEMISFVKRTKTLPKTSSINRETFEKHFEKILKENDAIIHFSLSSYLSSAYDNAVAASRLFANVKIINSESLSAGISLLALYAKKLAEGGETFEEIVEKTEKRIPFVQVSSVIDNLDYLCLGGRCSALKRFGANLLKLKPQIVIKNGKITSGKIYRGKYAAVVKKYEDDTFRMFDRPDTENVFVAYTTTDEPEVVKKVVEDMKDRGFKNVYLTQAGTTITSHCGENTLGIYYINDGPYCPQI